MLEGRRFSIRTKLIIIYLLIATPLIILLGIAFYDRFQADRQAALDERIQIARLASSNFLLFIDRVIIAEITFGSTIVDFSLTPEQASSYLSRNAERWPSSNLEFLDENGVVVAASIGETIDEDRSDSPPIRAILGGEESAVGNLQRNADGAPGFVIVTGIVVDGTLAGIVSMSINANQLSEELDIAVTQGGVNIVDSEGNLIFQSQVTEIPFDERDWSDEEFVQAALSGRTFTSTGLTFPIDNSLRMGAEIPIEEIEWATGSFVPVESVINPIRQAIVRSAIASIVVLIITLLVAFLVIDRFLGGLLELRRRMEVAPKTGFTEHVTITSGDEIEDLASSFNRMQGEIRSAQAAQGRLQEELRDRNRELSVLYENQKNVATILQKSLLPRIAQKIDHLEIGLNFQSATETALVGGDFFDFIEISDNRFGILIGDVSGKGIEAATLTATIRNTLRAFAYDEMSPAKIIEKVNRIAVIETPPSIFITLFYGVFNAETYDLVYANAGHWPPTIFRPEGNFEDLKSGGLPLGVFPDAKYVEYSTRLEPGLIITLFTDGVIESRANDELFGVARLQQTIKEYAGLSPNELAKTIVDKSKAFGGGKLRDDAAVMVIRMIK